MMGLGNLIRRNCRLFFKDKGMFFTSLITPVILLVLYATFLAKVYRDSFNSALPDIMQVSDKLIDATVGGELFSSLLAVSCVTVAFCSNMLIVQDRVNGTRKDRSYSDSCKQIHAGAELLHSNPYFNTYGLPDCNRSLLYISCRNRLVHVRLGCCFHTA